MKKAIKLKSIVTALLLVASLLCTVMFQPMTAYADEPHTHTDAEGQTITFTPWDGGTEHNTLPDTSGYYYLTNDISLNSSWNFERGEINLCLNGHVIQGGIVIGSFNYNCTVNLYDCNSETEHEGYTDATGLWHLGEKAPLGTGETESTIYGGVITGYMDEFGSGCIQIQPNSTFNMYGGAICGNKSGQGAGVDVFGTFNMFGGTICGNIAGFYGGGVYVEPGCTFNMSGGVICQNHTLFSEEGYSGGGGVCVKDGTFSMSGGTIRQNYATETRGDGVNLFSDDFCSVFNMSGGTISENRQGVYLNKQATFNMSGGIISGNATGVVVDHTESIVTLGDKAKIIDNETANLNLRKYSGVNLRFNIGNGTNGVLSPAEGMLVGVTTEVGATAETPVVITTNGAADETGYFVSDNPGYIVKYDTNHLVLAPHTHNLVKVDGQAATLTAAGWHDYYECKDSADACGAYFEDVSGSTPIYNLNTWKAEGGNGYIAQLSAPKYGITVLNDGNGTASASVSEATSGTAITLTATPSAGYTFDSWEVISGGITISGDAFTMPANAVEVNAKFKLATPEPGPTPDPEPDPEPQGNYLDSLDDMFEEAIATGSTDTIYWDEGDALPNYIMKLLFENPNLSFDFKYTYEGVEHEIYIGPGQATNDDIEWYGPLWLLEKYGEKKDLPQIHGVYIVADGDTLNKLAKKFNTTVDELLRLNPAIKDKNRIYIGYSLKY